jgi:sulfur transfer complex TusBCD TusB component (DsrH family)
MGKIPLGIFPDPRYSGITDMKSVTVLLLLVLFVLWAEAAPSVTLQWEPSPSTNVTNYKIYAWTNNPDANCLASNAVVTLALGNVTNATLQIQPQAVYTFAATAIATNSIGTNCFSSESQFSNFTYWQVPGAPGHLILLK